MTNFHTRASIGMGAPVPNRLTLRTDEEIRDALGVTVHHTGYGGTLFHPDPFERLRGIWRYHVETLGYGDIAYALGFDADANVFELRSGKYVEAHALGTRRGGMIPNRYTNGVVYLEDSRGWTRGGSVALAWIMDLFAFTHGGRHPHAFAHEWWSLTECPGIYLKDVVRVYGGSV